MTIAPLKPEEIDDLAAMYVKFINYLRGDCEEVYFSYAIPLEEEMRKYFEKKYNDPLHAVFIAKTENGSPAGFIAGDMRPSFFPFADTGLNGYISALFVEEKYRRTGLGNILENHIITQFFKPHHAKYIELHCLTKNTRAKKLWQSLGYNTFREQLRKAI